MKENNENLKAVFLEMVDNQIQDNSPPETRKTYERLLSQGHSDQEAREMIGAVVSSMMFKMLKDKKDFDEKQYIKDLQWLPNMPWE